MITFGIITNSKHHGSTDQNIRLDAMISSIEKENILEYEIIIVGDYKTNRKNTICIDFDESIKPAWITRKKNIITQNARGENIVFLHDYIILLDDWYKGFIKFGNDFDIQMNIIINKDGTRFRDWCVFKFDDTIGTHGVWMETTGDHPPYKVSPYIPPYNYPFYKNLYISGSYWIAKKYVMENEPLDERYVWGQPEDIEWSLRVLEKYKYVMNTNCTVQLLHQKDKVWRPLNNYYISNDYINKIREIE